MWPFVNIKAAAVAQRVKGCTLTWMTLPRSVSPGNGIAPSSPRSQSHLTVRLQTGKCATSKGIVTAR